jgi:class 3 adenylate cyclase/tetratricopeptide (TPR) repeat protein
MQCPKCGLEVSDQAIYCTNCGAQLKITCPKCKANTQAGVAFCSQCGAHLLIQEFPENANQVEKSTFPSPPIASTQPQSDPYERRTLTILFADIVGYTTISEILDPEQLAEIMNDAYPCILEPILEMKGSIVQVMGDGVLAYFGSPLAREDDPERAVLAALNIVDRIQTYSRKLEQDQILEKFQIRVGINTGLVIVGEMSPHDHLEYIAVGDAVNLAARLQKNAPKDGVLISHATYQQVRGLFDVEQQPPLIVNGRLEVEQTYLVIQQKPYHSRLRKRGLDDVATTMVGREPELAALKNIYRDAIQAGEPALALVYGDPGIGKTRLVNEFEAWVKSQSITPIILRGRAITGIQDVPYGVLRYMFARSFGILETDTSNQAQEKFRKGSQNFIDPEVADMIGQLVGFSFKASLFISEIAELYLKNYFLSLAEKSLLIILEDLQWMDDQTLDFISSLVAEFADLIPLQLMILCTARTHLFEERPKWCEGIFECRKLRLRRLSRLQSRLLIDEILFEAGSIPETFYACVIDEAEGNPLFIQEMIKMFIDEEVITKKEGSKVIQLQKLEDLHVPSTLNGILQARLDSLHSAERQVLQRAAIIGRTFWDGLLQILTPDKIESQKINLRLEALRNRGLIYQREKTSIAGYQEYLFKQAILCDVAYETVLLRHRCAYHKKIANWIEEKAGDRLEEHLALVANHYLKAGELDLAADWFIRAGERALNHSSLFEAKILFEKALDLIDNKDLDRLWRATLGHDEVVGLLGELDARHSDDESLLNLAKRFEDESLLAEAYYRVGSQAHREGNNQEALRAFNNALGILNTSDDIMMKAVILPMKISMLISAGDLEEAGSLVEEARSLAEQTQDNNVIARALTNIAPYYQAIGDITESVHLTQRQIDINQQQMNQTGEAYGLINLGYYYLSLGQFEMARRSLERAVRISRRMGAKNCLAYSLLNLGFALWRLDESVKACEVLGSSKDILQALDDQRGLAYREFYLGLACESENDVVKATKHFNLAIDSFANLRATAGTIESQAGLARLVLSKGDLSKAKELALQVYGYLDQEGLHGLELPILTCLTCAKVFDAMGDAKRLNQLLGKGIGEIQDQAAMIQKEDWRQIFLDAIPENRELLAYQKEGFTDLKLQHNHQSN